MDAYYQIPQRNVILLSVNYRKTPIRKKESIVIIYNKHAKKKEELPNNQTKADANHTMRTLLYTTTRQPS